MRAVRRIAKRIIIFILVLLVIYLLISNIELIRDLAVREKIGVVIDADAANGGDDLLAIWRIMIAEEIEVRGLFSSQWRLADLDNDSTVKSNQLLHSYILSHFRKSRIPRSPGSELPLAYSGEKSGKENEASASLIKLAEGLPYGQKLDVLCLGSATNLAAAILARPDISDRIVCHIQGPQYNPSRRAWNKNNPVSRLDLDAMNILLNSEKLEVYLLPANVASEMIVEKTSIRDAMDRKDSLMQFISRICLETGPDNDTLFCGSLALAEAFLNPDMVTLKQLITPPENSQRKIYVCTKIDAERMQKDLLKWIDRSGGNSRE